MAEAIKEWVVTDPSGKEYVVTSPAGASEDEVMSYAQQQFGSKPTGDQRKAGERVQDATLPYVGVNASSALATATDLGTQFAKGIIPTVGSVGGLIAGTAAAPFTGPLAPAMPLAGEAGGAALGEYVNQKLGITEPSGGQILLAGTMPGLTRGAVGLGRMGMGILAKAFGGRQVIGSAAGQIAEQMLKPPTPSEILYDQVAAQKGTFVPTFRAAGEARRIAREEIGNLPTNTSEEIKATFKAYAEFLQDPAGNVATVPMGGLARGVKDLRRDITAAYKADNSALADTLTSLRNALLDDADAVGIPALREASKAYRKEVAIEDLQNILMGPNPLTKFQDKMAKNGLFRGAFEKDAGKIENLIGRLVTVAPSGFSGVMGRALGAGAGNAVGGIPGMVAGAVAPDVTAWALSTAPGRRFLEKLLVGNVFDAPKAAALATFVRGQMAEDATTGQVAEAVNAQLKSSELSIESKINAVVEKDRIIKRAQPQITSEY